MLWHSAVKCQGCVLLLLMIFMDKHTCQGQVSLNVRDFVWVLFNYFFKQKLCTGYDGFDSADFWFGLKKTTYSENIAPYFSHTSITFLFFPLYD